MKSKASPKPMMISSGSSDWPALGILERDVLEYDGHFFRLVGGILEQLVDVVPAHRLDKLRDLRHAFVKTRYRLGQEIVALVLEAMNFVGRTLQFLRILGLSEHRNRLGDLLRLVENDVAEALRQRRSLVDVIEPHAPGRFFDPVDHVVQSRGQLTDIFAVQRSHESAVECPEDLVSN